MSQQQTASLNGAAAGRLPTTVSIATTAGSAADVIEAQDNERGRIARELHDSVGQKIAMLQVALAQIARDVALEARPLVLEAQAQVSDIAGELRAISHDLYPSRLHLLGVAKAIAALCRETSRQSGIDIAFVGHSTVGEVGQRESLCLYRIAQEAIQNIVKHSHARRASVALVRRRGSVELTVTDYGLGFDDSRPSRGLGMTSMRQRAQLLDGTIAVQTCKGAGTRIRVEIPLAPITRAAAGSR